MHLDRLMLVLVVVAASAAVLACLGTYLFLLSVLPIWMSLVIGASLALAAYILGQLIISRLTDPEEDHYDGMKH